ncbi:hypothetical protein AALA98_14610 [Lachnospiraceae bacterium 45-W7]
MMNRNKNYFKKLGKRCLSSLEKAKHAVAPGLSIMFDDSNVLTLIDREHFGRVFSVSDSGLYTLRLGAFHEMKKGAMEESALFFTLPTKSDCKQRITASFELPGASAKFLDEVVLTASRPFIVKLVIGSPMLESHHNLWGIPLNYDSIRTDKDTTVIVRTGMRENVPNQYKACFDVLSIQVKILFTK